MMFAGNTIFANEVLPEQYYEPKNVQMSNKSVLLDTIVFAIDSNGNAIEVEQNHSLLRGVKDWTVIVCNF